MSTGDLRSARYRALHETLSGYVDRGEVPGLVYAVEQDDGSTVDALGSRSVDGSAMTTDTIFRIASLTKPVVAAATMILVEDGRIDLDQPVNEVLPDLANRQVLRTIDAPLDDTVPASRPVTVRELLTFTWGFGIAMAPPDTYPIQRAVDELELGQGPPNPARLPAPDEWMRRLGSLPLMYQPGERWLYNTGADVLGVLVARIAGEQLDTFLQERIFVPLGMTDTEFSVPAPDIDRLATSYAVASETGDLQVYDPARGGQWSRPPAFASGAAGLVPTVDDYLAFARMLNNNGEHRGVRILEKPSIDLMTTNHLTPVQQQSGQPILQAGMGWGLGVTVITEPSDVPCSVGTYGWNGGLGTTWLNDPATGASLVLLTQVNWTSPAFPAISRDFLTTAFEATSGVSREGSEIR